MYIDNLDEEATIVEITSFCFPNNSSNTLRSALVTLSKDVKPALPTLFKSFAIVSIEKPYFVKPSGSLIIGSEDFNILGALLGLIYENSPGSTPCFKN